MSKSDIQVTIEVLENLVLHMLLRDNFVYLFIELTESAKR